MNIIAPQIAGIQHNNLQPPANLPAAAGHIAPVPLPPQAQPIAVQQLPANVAIVRQQMHRPAIAHNNLVTNTAGLKTVQLGTLASNPAIMEKLLDHATATGAHLSRTQIQEFVAMGEHIVKALQTPAQGAARLLGHVVTSVTPHVQISPNMESARAVSWYLAACAAGQDVAQEASGVQRSLNGAPVKDLTTKGAYVFQDRNNAIFNFLASSPLAYRRPSTHFNAQSATPLQANGALRQFGIEDFQRQLPGEGGAMLFDKLQGAPGQERMFLKLEHTGYPPLAGRAGRIDNNNEGQGNLIRTFGRKVQHACSFVHSTISGIKSKLGLSSTPNEIDRKEHVYKGILASSIYRPFIQVMQTAQKLGLDNTLLKQHEQSCEQQGMPHIEQSLQHLQNTIGQLPSPTQSQLALLYQLNLVQADIARAKTELGAQTNHLGLERKGAETHLDLSANPARDMFDKAATQLTSVLRAPALTQASTTHIPTGLNIPAGIAKQAFEDWHRSGITINGTHHPGNGAAVNPLQLNIATAMQAFLQACGNNTIAAEWMSRFLNQQLFSAVLDFLATQELGSSGSDLRLGGLETSIAVQTLANGDVEASINFSFDSNQSPVAIHQTTGNPVTLPPNAQLQGNFALRFENLQSYAVNSPPTPVISQPLECTQSGF